MKTYTIKRDGCFDVACPSCGMEPREVNGKTFVSVHTRNCELLGFRIMAVPLQDPVARADAELWRSTPVEPG